MYAADTDTHTIRCFNPQGEVVHTWGTPGVPGAPDQPFNQPTKAMRGPSGDLYVADGYGQYRIPPHFGRGESWSTRGELRARVRANSPYPHSLWVDRDERVWAVDREKQPHPAL